MNKQSRLQPLRRSSHYGHVILAQILSILVVCPMAFGQEVKITVSSKAGDRLTAKAPVHFEAPGKTSAPSFKIDAAEVSLLKALLGGRDGLVERIARLGLLLSGAQHVSDEVRDFDSPGIDVRHHRQRVAALEEDQEIGRDSWKASTVSDRFATFFNPEPVAVLR